MLSVYMQRLLLRMLLGQISRTRDTKSIYKNTSAFYRSADYLQRSGLISKAREGEHLSVYTLTFRGEMVARILMSLADIPPEIKRYMSIFKTSEKIDLKHI